MSNSGKSNIGGLMDSEKNALLPPKSPLPAVPPPPVGPGSLPKGKDVNSHHHRSSSESFSMLEKPAWLDELLDEQEAPVRRGAHRRSSSESFANVETANLRNVNLNFVMTPGYSLWGPQGPDLCRNGPWRNPYNMDLTSGGKIIENSPWKPPVDSGVAHPSVTSLRPSEDQVESSAKDPKISCEKRDLNLTKPSAAETKRARQQQYAERSRVRKLQYIAELQRNIQALQVKRSALSAEKEFLKQQNLMLLMQNNAMRQRLDCLAQEQLIKQVVKENLERELQELRSLNQQKQQQSQLSSGHQRANSKDVDEQLANLSLKKEEGNPGLDQLHKRE